MHDSIGFNFKFTELQAIVGIEQMKKLPWRVERKREVYGLYRDLLGDISEITFFEQNLKHTIPWFMDILGERRDALQIFLKEAGIGTRVMYPPINAQKAYQRPGSYPVSETVGQMGLWLPSFTQINDGEVEYVCSRIRHFYQGNQGN